MFHDLRYAWRALTTRPSFVVGTVVVHALAVGAVAYGQYRELRATVDVFSALAATAPEFGRLRSGGDVLQRSSLRVKEGATFRLLGARRVRLPFQGAYYMDVPRILATLGAMATLLLVIAGTNLGGMLRAGGVSRRAGIAIRLSLGIVREGGAVAIAGIALGLALAFAAIRYASHAIVPLPGLDAPTLAAVPVILAAIVLAACYLPARRAGRVDPLAVSRRG